MSEIYDYIITKPPLDEDTLAHYGIKGMKWHKHLKSKYYSAKSKLQEKIAKARRKKAGLEADEISTTTSKHNQQGFGSRIKYAAPTGVRDTGTGVSKGVKYRFNSNMRSYDRSDSEYYTPGRTRETKESELRRGIEAGRKRAGIKKKK